MCPEVVAALNPVIVTVVNVLLAIIKSPTLLLLESIILTLLPTTKPCALDVVITSPTAPLIAIEGPMTIAY